LETGKYSKASLIHVLQMEKTMNNERLTQSATTEQEDKAVDAAINILLIFLLALTSFAVGYYVAMNEAAALVKTI
jgi:phosphate/sulfate permease